MSDSFWLNVLLLALGFWLLISAFILGGVGTLILANNAISGIFLMLIALKNILSENNKDI